MLDIWFEPIYKEKKALPKINGYEGKVVKKNDGNYVQYGCAEINAKFFHTLNQLNPKDANYTNKFGNFDNRTLASIKFSSGVEVTMEEVNQIAEYLEENK